MNQSTLGSLIGGGAALLIAAGSTVAFASTHAASPQPSVSTSVDSVRHSFGKSGFQVDQPHAWNWMDPPYTSVQIHDPASGRVLMAMIYPDSAAAQTARKQALAHDSGQAEPHLIEGYGPSVWNANVAIVESTQAELNHLFQTRLDAANGVEVDTNLAWEHSVSDDAVDMDFQQALVNTGTVNL